MGCWPPGRSMILSRRMPRASPGARGSPTKKPASSGPRRCMAAVMTLTRDSASAVRAAKATPQIPHTLAFDLRSRKENRRRADQMFAEMEARNLQAPVGVPAEIRAQKKKKLAFEQQTPIKGFVPSGRNRFQHSA